MDAEIGTRISVRIRAIAPRLTGASRAIAAQILDDPAVVIASSISELAALAGVSTASVSRFSSELGLSGYPALRLALASENGSAESNWERDLGVEIRPDDSAADIAQLILRVDKRALEKTAEQLPFREVEAAAEALIAARKVNVYGAGDSAIVAQELQFRLHRIARSTWSFSEAHVALMSASLLQEGDVFFGISRSGRTTEVCDALDVASAGGARTIVLTGFPQSPAAQQADIVLTTHVEAGQTSHGSLAARSAQLFVTDILYSVVAQKTIDQSGPALTRSAEALASRRTGRTRRKA